MFTSRESEVYENYCTGCQLWRPIWCLGLCVDCVNSHFRRRETEAAAPVEAAHPQP